MQLPILRAKSLLRDLALTLALTPSLLSSVLAQTINTGNGKMVVVNGTTDIGCLDVTGAYVLNNCATFSNGGGSSSDGACDWSDTTKTLNPFVGAPPFHALSCYTTGGHTSGLEFYYFNNNTDKQCTGNLECYYVVPTAQPATAGQKVDLQLYFWDDTTDPLSVPSGWTLVTLKWLAVSS